MSKATKYARNRLNCPTDTCRPTSGSGQVSMAPGHEEVHSRERSSSRCSSGKGLEASTCAVAEEARGNTRQHLQHTRTCPCLLTLHALTSKARRQASGAARRGNKAAVDGCGILPPRATCVARTRRPAAHDTRTHAHKAICSTASVLLLYEPHELRESFLFFEES